MRSWSGGRRGKAQAGRGAGADGGGPGLTGMWAGCAYCCSSRRQGSLPEDGAVGTVLLLGARDATRSFHVLPSAQVVPGLAFNFCFYDTFRNIALAYQWRQLIAQQPQQPEAGGAQQPGPGGSGADPAGAAASPSPLASALCACAAGWCTSSLTFPLDVVRRRLQVGWARAGAGGGWYSRSPCGAARAESPGWDDK